MGQVRGWRADDESCISNIERLREQIRNKSIEEYGRPDVPSYVQRAAESYALRKRVSNSNALDALIIEAGSFEALASQLSKEYRKRAKKANKLEREKIEAAQKNKSPSSQLQSAIEASKRSKYVSIVLGGAPGLGKKS